MKNRTIKHLVTWLLAGVTVLFLLTGFGITIPGVVTSLTGGLLSKPVSYQVHTFLWGPFLILILIHVYLGMKRRTT